MDSLRKSKAELAAVVAELEVHREAVRAQEQALADANESLELATDRYPGLFDFAPVAYVQLDDAGLVLEANQRALSLLGGARNNLAEWPLVSLVAPRDRASLLEHLRRCRLGEPRVVTDLSIVRRGGGTADVRLISAPALDQHRLVRVLHTVLLEAEQSIPILSPRTAHELRTLLTPILLAAGQLERMLRPNDDAAGLFEMIRRNVQAQAGVIDRLTRSEPVPLQAGEPSPIEPGGRTKPLRILLVEDHEDTGTLLASSLRQEGHQVARASSMAAALAWEGPIDLLLSDIDLPDGSGHELFRRIAAVRGPLRAIALSANATPLDVRRSIEVGFEHHLAKPVEIPQLLAALAGSAR